MMRSRFDEQLSHLNSEMIEMGAMCESIISKVLQELLTTPAKSGTAVSAASATSEASAAAAVWTAETAGVDRPLQCSIAELGAEVDRKERTIETLYLKLLLQQQPVARDLRQISAALKMITDMERIGDQAEDIAEIIPFVENRPAGMDPLLDEMTAASIRMVTRSVDAFVARDVALARNVVESDDIVDNCFTRIRQELIGEIIANPEDGGCAIDLMMIAKYLERIGDHAVNIAEWVIFSVTGIHRTI